MITQSGWSRFALLETSSQYLLALYTLSLDVYSQYCSIYISLYISYGANKENLFNNQELLWLVIISFILLTLMRDSRVIVFGEIR